MDLLTDNIYFKQGIIYLSFGTDIYILTNVAVTAAVAQWVRVFAPQGWVFESQQRQTQVVKTGSDSSTAKRSAIGMSVTGPRR